MKSLFGGIRGSCRKSPAQLHAVTSIRRSCRAVLRQGPLFKAIQKQAACLTSADRMQFHMANLRRKARLGNQVLVGTFVAGCELLAWVLKCLSCHWHMAYGIRNYCVHAFSADIDAWKQALIYNAWSPRMLFGDVVELASSGWRGFERCSKQVQKVPLTYVHVAGFECDSISSLNSHARDCRRFMSQTAGGS